MRQPCALQRVGLPKTDFVSRRNRIACLVRAGSSFAWERHSKIGCDNLIPIEIVFKITAAIAAGERFTAYVVIPEHPDTKGAAR